VVWPLEPCAEEMPDPPENPELDDDPTEPELDDDPEEPELADPEEAEEPDEVPPDGAAVPVAPLAVLASDDPGST
jgi:hypothetical protein